MDPLEREKLNRIEELKSKLFSKDYRVRVDRHEGMPHFPNREVKDFWEDENVKNSQWNIPAKTSVFKKFFIFSVVFFLLAIGYAAYTMFVKTNTVSNDNIDIAVLSNAFAAGGEEYPLQLEITNRNTSPLELADLVVEYPKGTQAISSGSNDGSLDSDNEHIRLSLDTIPAGSVKSENVKFVLYGEQDSTVPIKISLEYRVEGSNAIFVKDKVYDISISSTPVNLFVDVPNTTSANQEVTLTVKATLNSTKPAPNMLLKVDYPIGFQFENANPSPTIGNNVWNMGDLAPGAERDITIIGKMVDVSEGEEKVFRTSVGSGSQTDKSMIDVVYNSLSKTVAISKAGVAARLYINGVYQSSYAVDTKTSIGGQIQWSNNLETKINDLSISAKIYGNALDRNSISAQDGYYNSSKNTIVWDKNSNSNFQEVNPGDSGTLSFSLSSLPLFSAGSGLLSSPTINVDVSISGSQSENGGAVAALNGIESKTIRMISDLGLSAKASYASGPFTNTGPLPPKAEQKTTYTITWGLSNTANSISQAQVVSTLPPWVRFVGKTSPSSEDLSYDSSTGNITWNVGSVAKGLGITNSGRSVSFQVELTPSLSQVGTAPVILNDSVLTGHDDFANVDVRVNKTSLNTQLFNDPNFPTDGDRVVN